jgi:hypothetical protein
MTRISTPTDKASKCTLAKRVLASFVFAAAICGSASAAPLTFKTLTLIHYWTNSPFGTGVAAAAIDSEDVVHLKGAIYQPTGTDIRPFKLPSMFRPNRSVYVPVDCVSGSTGRLNIFLDGTVEVEAGGSQSDCQKFTSLEGVTYSKN